MLEFSGPAKLIDELKGMQGVHSTQMIITMDKRKIGKEDNA